MVKPLPVAQGNGFKLNMSSAPKEADKENKSSNEPKSLFGSGTNIFGIKGDVNKQFENEDEKESEEEEKLREEANKKATQQRSAKVEQQGLTRLFAVAVSSMKIEKLGPITQEKKEEKERAAA